MSHMSRDSMLRLLKECTEQGATEVHFKVPNRPLLRMGNGALVPSNNLGALGPDDVKAAIAALGSLASIELALARTTDDEFSFGVNGLGRFRVFVYKQRGTPGVVVRRVGTSVPSLEAVGLSASVEEHVGRPGILLVAGQERTRVLHALVQGYNARERGNVVIVESPLTCLHRDAMAAISHREVGTDVPDFPTAIGQALRIGTDLLALGEIADAATAEAALTAAEKRTPVLAAVAAPTAGDAPWWIARLFTGQQREDVERRLDRLLLGTVVANAPGRAEVVLAGV